MVDNPLLTLAEHAASWRSRPLPDAVAHHARRALIDWFAALLPGLSKPPATLLAAALAAERGPGRSICYVDGQPSPLRHAALLNATASHTVEFDDIFRDAGYHPGCPTIAPALAAVQQQGGSMDDLLRAITAGYEVSCRIGMAVQPEPLQELAHHRHRRHLRRGGRHRRGAGLRCGEDRPRHRHRGDLRRRAAAGVPVGFHVEAAASRPCRRRRRAGGDRRRGRRDRCARCAARAEGLRRGDQRGHRQMGQGAGRPRQPRLHHRDDLQEPRLLRPYLRGARCRAGPAAGTWLQGRGRGEDPGRRLRPDEEHLRPAEHHDGAGGALLGPVHYRRAAGARRRPHRRLRRRQTWSTPRSAPSCRR